MTYGVIPAAEVVTNPACVVTDPAEIAETAMAGWKNWRLWKGDGGVAKLETMAADADKVSEP